MNVKCYSEDLTLKDIQNIRIGSANGITQTNKSTNVQFETIGNQECVVLNDSPDLLSVGSLVEQGYAFHWVPPNSSKDRANQRAYLVTPDGRKLELSIHERLPYLEQDDDNKSECDFDLDMSPSVGTTADKNPTCR